MSDETVTVDTTRGEVRVRAEIFDSRRGERFGSARALDPEGRLAAYLDYSLFEGRAHVQSRRRSSGRGRPGRSSWRPRSRRC